MNAVNSTLHARMLTVWSGLVISTTLLSTAALADCDATSVTQSGNTWVVSPTGNDDTANLQCALDEAQAAGPGSTVALTAGTFATGFLDVTDYVGRFEGAGMNATTITSLPDLDCAALVAANSLPILVKFRRGDVAVSNLSFRITEALPCNQWQIPPNNALRRALGAILGVTTTPLAETDCQAPPTDLASSRVEQVGFFAETTQVNFEFAVIGEYNYSPTCNGTASKRTSGNHAVVSSVFEAPVCTSPTACATSAVFTVGLTNGRIEVGGDSQSGNSMENFRAAILFADSSNSALEASHNTLVNNFGFGILIEQGLQAENGGILPEPSDYVVKRNDIVARGRNDGIGIDDTALLLTGQPTISAVITQNNILLDGTILGGIAGLSSEGVFVGQNNIEGTGLAGIYLGARNPASGWTIQGNNVQHVTGSSPLSPNAAPILLHTNSLGNVVVGGSNQANVVDLGVDNIITGVNNMQGNPPGPELSEALEEKKETLRSF